MENNKIGLSVIIPIYNAGKYISQCIESITKSFQANIEILVIDDGSTDNSKSEVERFAHADKRVKYIFQNNSGVSVARNKGLDNAVGKYILFLDADDYIETEIFNNLVSRLEQNMPDFTAYSKKILYPDGSIKKVLFDFKDNACNDKQFIYELMYASSAFNECWGKVFKKEIIDTYKLRFPEGIKIGEDLLFVYNYFEKCKSFELVNEAILVYRQHDESVMKNSLAKDRLSNTKMLYNIGQSYLDKINDSRLKHKADIYYFRVITNLCREFARSDDAGKCIRMIYSSDITSEIVSKLRIKMIPLYKKHEFILMKFKMYRLSAVYYRLKARA